MTDPVLNLQLPQGEPGEAGSSDPIVIGQSSTAETVGAIAIGTGALANGSNTEQGDGTNSIAIGTGAQSTGGGSIAIGCDDQGSGFAVADHEGAVALGANAYAQGFYSVSIGGDAVTSADHAIAIGESGSGHGSYSVGINGSASGDHSVMVGFGSTGGDFSLGLGSGVHTGAAGAVAIGTDHTGFGPTVTVQDDFVLGTSLHTVRVSGKLRVDKALSTAAGVAGAASALPATPSAYVPITASDGVEYLMPVYAKP